MAKKLGIYIIKFQLGTPVIALCLYLLPYNLLTNTIIANVIGAFIFFPIDNFIFTKINKKKEFEVVKKVKAPKEAE